MRIFLTGFMGSGKSYWGRLWAEESGLTFYDLDDIIEADERMTIDAIFDKKGEPYFRQKESASLRNLVDYDNCIIACGGGTACYDDNMKWMNENGTTVYLQATAFRLLENIITEIDKRPALKKINKAEVLFFIEQKLNERIEYYSAAKIHLQVSELDKTSIREIIQSSKNS